MGPLLVFLLLFSAHTEKNRHALCVDQIEVNRVYNDDGKLWLEQVIFWRWEPCVGWACEGWRRLDHGTLRKVPHGWRWEEPGLTVEARVMRQSWTQYDREAENRDEWPVGRRMVR